MTKSRFQFGLRFMLFWLMPYAAIVTAILATESSGISPKRGYFQAWGWGVRGALLLTVTCVWLTVWGITWAVRNHRPTEPPRPN